MGVILMAEIEAVYNSFEEACKEGNLSTVEEIVQQLRDLTKENAEANTRS